MAETQRGGYYLDPDGNAKNAFGEPVEEEQDPDNGSTNTDLDSADFASKEGFELASESGLTPDDFEGVDPSGETGYTKADVEGVLEGREE